MTAQRIALVLVALLAGPLVSPALAQSSRAAIAPSAPAGPWPPVKLGDTVWVTVADGSEMQGVVRGYTPTTIELQGAMGMRQFQASEIHRLAGPDSLRNGFLIGAAVGVLSGVGYTIDAMNPKAPGPVKVVFAVFNVGFGVWFYGKLGRWIDSKVDGRRTIYEKPAGASVQFSPVVSMKGVGVGGSIRW